LVREGPVSGFAATMTTVAMGLIGYRHVVLRKDH